MKKILSLCLAVLMLAACVSAFASCGDSGEKKMKVGFIFLHDENSTYDLNFMQRSKGCLREPSASTIASTFSRRTSPKISQMLTTLRLSLLHEGCNVIFADSFGHEDFIIEAAKEFPRMSSSATATGTQGSHREA